MKQQNLSKVLEEGNTLLEAGIIEGALQLKLTVSQSPDSKKIYSAQLKRLEENGQLKENFETLPQVFAWMSDTKNFKIDMNSISVIYMAKMGSKIIELGEIILVENDEVTTAEGPSLEDMIDQCSLKGQLTNDEIKKNFEILANEIVELKRQRMGENEKVAIFDNLKAELFGKVSEENAKVSQLHQNVEQKYSAEIALLRKQIEVMNTRSVSQTLNFENFQKLVGEDSLNFKNTLKNKTDGLSGDIKNLSQNFKENTKKIEIYKEKVSNQSQKIEIIQLQLKQFNAFIAKQKLQNLEMEKQKVKSEFYKRHKWSNLFDFDGKTLLKVKEDDSWHQFVFFEFVPFDKEFRFKVKIIKSQHKFIMIGVVDYDKQKEQKTSCESNNAISYYAKGYKYPGQIKEGYGVDVGQTVEVRVDRKNKTIRWMVNNEERASYVHYMLGDQNMRLMPHIEMCNIGDMIEFSL